MTNPYPDEILGEDDDNGTMVNSKDALAEAVVGHKIVKIEKKEIPHRYYGSDNATVIELDNGKQVILREESDCCAYTELESFLLHPDKIDHIITGVGTTEGYTKWHIFADFGDVVEMNVGWSCGNPFYYGYGFEIEVVDIPA